MGTDGVMAKITARRKKQWAINWERAEATPPTFPKVTQKELLRCHPRMNVGQLLVWIATRDRDKVAAAGENVMGKNMGWAVAALVLDDRMCRTGEKFETWIDAALTALRSGRIGSVGRLAGMPSRQLQPSEWDQFSICLAACRTWRPARYEMR